jgi:hypothetical protein
MKRILSILLLLSVVFISKAQNPIPSDSTYPVNQSLANAPTSKVITNAIQAKDGFINAVFTDTTAANLYSNGYRIKYFPGAQMFTTSDSTFWVRNSLATRWMRASSGGGSIVSFNFITDSSLIVCYGDGTCDTIDIYNFSTAVTNIVQNFNDSSVYNLNDSTLIICVGEGDARVCDTIDLGTTNTYYFTVTGDTLITCDTVQIICPLPDSCYQQQICDTIVLSNPPPSPVYQNYLRLIPNTTIREFGYEGSGEGPGNLIHNTWAYTNGNQLTIQGRPIARPPLMIQQDQWISESPSIIGFNHFGSYPNAGLVDAENTVNLYLNYTNPFDHDTIGFMYDRIGYMWIGNSQGGRYSFSVNNSNSKQAGILIHTLDTAYTDGVTIFAQQVSSSYNFANNPPVDSTLLSKRVAVFKTNQQQQLPAYINDAFADPAPEYAIGVDDEGNLVMFPPGGGGVIVSANNGTSVSSNNVQLGQAVAAVGNPAILLSHREIPMGGFTLSLNASAAQSANIFQTKNSSAAIRARINSAAAFSNTGGQTGSEIFGDGASVSGQNSIAIGNSAVATEQSTVIGNLASNSTSTGSDVVIGKSAINSATNPGSVLIGNSTSSTGTGGSNVLIGQEATSSNATVVGIGYQANVSGVSSVGVGAQVVVGSTHQYSQAYGAGATTTAANQLVFGATSALLGGINDVYIGRGVTSTVNGDLSIQTTGGSGTDDAGGDLFINGAKATGNAAGGEIYIGTSDVGGSGTTLQTVTSKAVFSGSLLGIGRLSGFGATRLDIVDNAVGAASIVNISSTSTEAATDLQKGLNVSLSGANTNVSQDTYGVYSSNTHTGTGSINYGVYGTSTSGAANYGVYGVAESAGVFGSSTNGTGVYGQSTNGAGTRGIAQGAGSGLVGQSVTGFILEGYTTSNAGAVLQVDPASTNTVIPVLQLSRSTSGTSADNIGASLEYYLETSGTVGQPLSNSLVSKWSTADNDTRTSQFIIRGVNSTSTGDIISFEGNKRTMLYGRLEMQQGADVSSAAGAIAVGLDGNVFELTGTNAVTLISNLNFVNGSVIHILFTSTATLTDGTANSGTDIGMELVGNTNFVGSADDVVTLVLSEIGGTQRWRMVSSSVN